MKECPQPQANSSVQVPNYNPGSHGGYPVQHWIKYVHRYFCSLSKTSLPLLRLTFMRNHKAVPDTATINTSPAWRELRQRGRTYTDTA